MESLRSSQNSRQISESLIGAFIGAELGVLFGALLAARADGVPVIPAIGLWSPIGLLMCCVVALWTLMLHGGAPLKEFLLPAHRRWGIILSGPALVCAWWAVGQLALRLLVAFHERPLVGGVLMATSSLGCFVFSAWIVSLGATALCRVGQPPSLRMTLVLSLCGPVLLASALIVAGSKSGAGTPWALFGVFKRDELELGPVWQLLQVGCFSYLGALAARKWRSFVTQLGLAILGLVLMAASVVAASGIDFRTAVKIERSPGLAVYTLKLFQKWSDTDGDGFSTRFGGGDCDDSRAEISPRAKEIPDNGKDENCSGSDLTLAGSAPGDSPSGDSPPSDAAPEPEVLARLPDDANFLLLTIDTLRHDLGYTGAHKNAKLSPRLDELAAKSTVFERAYALASYTSKSLGPMMIGRYPSETARTFEHFDRFPAAVPFVQERLQSAGVRTVSVQGYWYFFFKGYGFERGWDVLDSSAAPKLVAIEGDKTSNGDELADAAIAQLDALAKEDKRFFMWTHWVDPHAEYVAHEAHDYGSESRERYDGEVSFVDAQVGRILDALSRLSLDDDTVVLVTSDHGEAFGEHGMIRHGFEVWDELVQVPLIVHVPGAKAKLVRQRRSLIDVTATILDQFEIDVKETENEWLRGTSLFQDVFTAEGKERATRPILVDMPEGPHNQQRQAFYHGDLKLIVSRGRALGLYDLSKDPQEKQDLSADEELLAKVKDELDRYLAKLRDVPATR